MGDFLEWVLHFERPFWMQMVALGTAFMLGLGYITVAAVFWDTSLACITVLMLGAPIYFVWAHILRAYRGRK